MHLRVHVMRFIHNYVTKIKMAAIIWGTLIFSSTSVYGDEIFIGNILIKKEDIKL